MVHGALPNVTGITTLEDGGEMVAMSFICWYAFNLFKRSPETVICLLNNSTIKYANLVFDHLHGLVNFLHITPKKLAKKPY